MGAFGGLILTNTGRALQAKAQAGATLTFTRIGVGDGDLGGQSIPTLNALISEKKSLTLNKLKTQPNYKAVVGAVLSNQDVITGFYFKELGVFAQDPDVGEILYCYGNSGAGAEYIPAGGGPDIIEKQIDCITIVGNASSVTATIDGSLVYATQQELQAHISDTNNPHAVTAAQIGAIPATEKGAAGGVASLDAGGQVPASELGNVPPVNAATTTTKGTVKIAAAPASGDPITPSRTASASDVQIVGTTAQTIATFTPAAAGNFLVHIYFRVVTGTTNVTIEVDYADGSGAQANVLLNAQAEAVGSYSLVPLFINAVAGTAIVVKITASVANQVFASAAIVGV